MLGDGFDYTQFLKSFDYFTDGFYYCLLSTEKNPTQLSVKHSVKNRNTKHVIFIYIAIYLGFFVLFFSGVRDYYEDSFLSGEAICDFKLFLVLYKLNLMPAQNNMRKL